MQKYRILGVDMDYHGALVASFIESFPSLVEAEKYCREQAPIGVRYMVDKTWKEGVAQPNYGAYRQTVIDQYMKKGML
jgi:hypothetical protein